MTNLLTLPFKYTSTIPLKSAFREYIQFAHPETHPDAFKWDIAKWENMRRDATSNTLHISTADRIIAYQAQLVFILTKLPVDIHLSIPYTPTFPPNSPPVSLSNLAYERVNTLYVLAALYCQLGTSEDRSNNDGIKRAVAYFQNAAGVLSHIISSALPALEKSFASVADLPVDLSRVFLKALERLLLAQAQECFWQRALVDDMKTLLLAKLSLKTSLFYRDALDAMESDPKVSSFFPREWISHVRTKCHHFSAAAYYRKSVDDLEGGRYGEEIARLQMAKAEAKKALDAARKGGVARAVQDDTKALYDALETSTKRAERDNDLIYHHVVPSPSSIQPIQEIKDVVTSIVPLGVKDPKAVVKEGTAILWELSGWGVRVAIDIYKERKKDWVQMEILDRAKQLDAAYLPTLRALNLPAALDALDRPIGLPPSLLGKAEEVRLEGGMQRIPGLIEDAQRLARINSAALNEALDILDQEASEDEDMRSTYGADGWNRPASHVANRELTEPARRYREALENAAESHQILQDRWEEWSDRIDVLCWDESDIERAVPSSTLSSSSGGSDKSTQGHARALRSHLESLDDIVRARADLVQRVQRVSDADDVKPRFMNDAAAVARWVEIRPEIFESAIEEELSKYDRFREELEDGERRQEAALDGIRERNTLFLDSRQEDPSVKAREHALQSLDLAYHEYRDIQSLLTEEIKFQNDFTTILAHLKERCKGWVMERRRDVEMLTHNLHSMSVAPTSEAAHPLTPIAPHASYPEPQLQSHKPPALGPPEPHLPGALADDSFAADLPPPDSDAWQSSSVRPPAPLTHPEEEFALDLPPPDSAAWETIAAPTPPRKAPVPKQSRKARRTGV